MSPERWHQIEECYNAARTRDHNERAEFLAEVCAGDDALRREVESLLSYRPRAESFMESSAGDAAAKALEPSRGESLVGSRLEHYEVLARIGAGGMGEVWRARDTKLNRDVAIKTLPEEFAFNSDRLARFEREARFLAALNHPNIAAIYGLEEFGETRFLVLELVEGETLADRIKRGPIPANEGLRIAIQIADALEAAHEKGVIHRDLKPANIKITADGNVKVLDFGVAKAFLRDAGINLSKPSLLSMGATRQGIILGTAGYMPPEQARGQAVDKRADIWAFGCVLFEILSGRGPFAGETVSDALAAVLKTEPDWNSLPANLHPRILHLLERCLEKEPRDRCPGMADVRFEIKKVLADPGGVLARPAAGTRAGLRSGLPWIAAIAGLAVIASILGWAALKPPQPARVVQFPFFLPEDQVVLQLPGGSGVAISRDGIRIAYSANDQLYLRNLNEMEPRPIPGTRGRLVAGQPTFSPDGQWLAYQDVALNANSFSLKRIPVSGGAAVTLIEYSPLGLRDLTWTANDTILFATSEGILEIRADGGTPAVIIKAMDGETLSSPKLLPGGKSLMFSSTTAALAINRWDSAQIFVQPLESESRQLVWQGGGDPRYITTGHIVYAQGNTLFAVSFDIDGLAVMGAPEPIVEGVRRSSTGASGTGNYDFSDTGTLVYIPGTASVSKSDGLLALVDRNGGRRMLNVSPRRYRSPRLSPVGGQLVVEAIGNDGRSSIWIYELSGDSDLRLLTQTGSNTSPIWTPDGKSVTFASDRDGTWSIYSQRADGNALAERLTTGEQGVQQLPESWSRNARTLSFSKISRPRDSSLWTFSMGSRTSELFQDSPGGNDFSSDFSPDGRWLAYAVTEDPAGIRVQPFPPTGVIHQVSEKGEMGPVWSADGDELFFRSSEGVVGEQPVRLTGVDISTTGAFGLRSRRTLVIQDVLMYADHRDYDIAPDGKHFVLIVPVDSSLPKPPARAQINIVLNWFEELKARVPRR